MFWILCNMAREQILFPVTVSFGKLFIVERISYNCPYGLMTGNMIIIPCVTAPYPKTSFLISGIIIISLRIVPVKEYD